MCKHKIKFRILYDVESWFRTTIISEGTCISFSSWNQPVLSNKGKVSCSRKQQGPLMGLKPTTFTLRVRHATHCATPPLNILKSHLSQYGTTNMQYNTIQYNTE